MFFNEDQLKITKVRTSDGISPLMDESGERTLKKIVFLPDNKVTLKLLEEQNTRLPTALKMKIEKVPAYKPVQVNQIDHDKETEALTLKNLELEDEVNKLKKQMAELQQQKVQEPAIPAVASPETATDLTKNKVK